MFTDQSCTSGSSKQDAHQVGPEGDLAAMTVEAIAEREAAA